MKKKNQISNQWLRLNHNYLKILDLMHQAKLKVYDTKKNTTI